MLSPDDVRALAKASAQAKGHPDPDSYAEDVVNHYTANVNAAVSASASDPAAPTAPAV